MHAPNELERLAAARPPVITDTGLLVSPVVEKQILAQVLSTQQVTDGAPTIQRRSRMVRALQLATSRPAAGRRPRVSRAGLAAATAVALAAAVTGATLAATGSRPQAVLTAQTVAYRTSTALMAALQQDVIYTKTSFAPDTAIGGFSAGLVYQAGAKGRVTVLPAASKGAPIASIRAWARGMQDREKQFGATGALLYDESAVVAGGQWQRRFVSYPGRSCKTASRPVSQVGLRWWNVLQDQSLFAAWQGSHTSGPPSGLVPAGTVTKVTIHGRRMLKLTEAWPRPRLDLAVRGVKVHQFAAGPQLVDLPVGAMPQPVFTPGSAFRPVSTTIWVDATTYLPVRATVNGVKGKVLVDERLTMLSPSKANSAELTPALAPASFPVSPEPWQ